LRLFDIMPPNGKILT